MRRLVVAALVVAAVTALATGSFAIAKRGGDGGSRFSTKLSGWQEVPTQLTTGEGSFRARVIRVAGDLAIEYTLRYEDLEGAPTIGAHIHIGDVHENGTIAAFLCPNTPQVPACPPREAELRGVIERSDVGTQASAPGQGLNPGEIEDLIRAMRRGETYVNVHTGGTPPRAPGGEIRGQIRRGGGHGRG